MKTPALCSLAVAMALANFQPAMACCVVTRGEPAVNADQTVILIWDEVNQMEHFIRKASFKSDGADVGFLVPTPNRPQLEEAGNHAFDILAWATAPIISRGSRYACSPGCSSEGKSKSSVRIIEEKLVAGFNAVVLEADDGASLASWLQTHGYHYAPEVAAWAEPYLQKKWLISAMRVAKQDEGQNVDAGALRISFKTDRPLFPYRESDTRVAANKLGVKDRLLRIYFIANSRYEGNELAEGIKWSGQTVWSGPLEPHVQADCMATLKLPQESALPTWWLTEFEDHWAYGNAPGDLYFSKSADQSHLERTAAARPLVVDPLLAGMALAGLLPLRRRWNARRPGKS